MCAALAHLHPLHLLHLLTLLFCDQDASRLQLGQLLLEEFDLQCIFASYTARLKASSVGFQF